MIGCSRCICCVTCLCLTCLKDPGTSSVPAQLVSLDSSLPGFSEDMRRLDELSSRYCYSALVFYVRAGQRTAAEVTGLSVSTVCLTCLSQLSVSPFCLTCLSVDPEERGIQPQRPISLPGLHFVSWSSGRGGTTTSGRSQNQFRSVH